MSSTIESVPVNTTKQGLPWSLWLRQIRAIFRMEIEKNFLGRRAILIYLLALLPLSPLLLLCSCPRPCWFHRRQPK